MLPPGVDAKNWTAALNAFRAAVGTQWVFTSDEDVGLYRDAYSPLWGEADERLVSAAIAPDDVAQVQAIVRIANSYRIPIFPISTGKNLGYGGSAPNLSGSVVVDLKRMNRIIAVDDKRHHAIVEPGVSYFDLYKYIQDRQLKCWIDCPDPGWGSLVGNALDHGVGHTLATYRDHFHAHCGMEVVLPNGELLRTGMGAMATADSWADFRYGAGPAIDGLFGQGNFGIVTKMGFHLMPQPQAFLSRRVLVPRRQDMIPLVELVNELEYTGVIGMPIFDSPLVPLHMAGDKALADLLASQNVWTSDAIDRFAADRQIAYWTCDLQFYGPKAGIEANWRYAQDRLRETIPGVRFEDLDTLAFPLSATQQDAVRHKVLTGIPNLNIFSLGARSALNPNPADGHLLFSPIVPRTGEDLFKAQKIFADGLHGSPLAGIYTPFTPPFTWVVRAFALTAGFPISRSDPAINAQSRQAVETLIRLGADNGYGEYRTPPLFQDLVQSTYSFGDNINRKVLETLKDALDESGIMAAGRYGIWPKHLRKGGQ